MMGCRISRDTDVKVKSEEKLRDELLLRMDPLYE